MSDKKNVSEEYFDNLVLNIKKDKRVIELFLKVATSIANTLATDIGLTDKEHLARVVVEIYYMLRSQEKARVTTEYYDSLSRAAGATLQSKDLIPPIPTDDGEKGEGGFGIN